LPTVSSDVTRSGQYALAFTIDTSDGLDRAARAFRAVESEPAYYSAWFFLNEDHDASEWWSIFLFRAHDDPADIGAAINLWDVDLVRGAQGELVLSLYDHLSETVYPADELPFPVQQWVHLEAYLGHAAAESTDLALYLNGVLALELTGLGPSPAPWLVWAIGNGSSGLTPPVSTIYADDAAVSAVRLGP
jgi:hypothetical protein